jgi:N-hydroxyarylamine O-acetyltransferase
MNSALDLDRYFRRIGYDGSRAPTLETLRAIHLLHPQAIPFENLDPLLNRPVRLDHASLQGKLVDAGRGGYCFEQNLLFRHVLTALGFRPKGLAARVVWMMPASEGMPPRSHMILLLEVDGDPYIADVGFGGVTLTAPLRLQTGIEQATPHGPMRLMEAAGDFLLEAKIRNEWTPVYSFDLREQYPVDYEITNWYHSTCPDSQFVTNLVAARPVPGCRHALRNNLLTSYFQDGRVERRSLHSAAELKDVLENVFGLALPDVPNLLPTLARLAESAEAKRAASR